MPVTHGGGTTNAAKKGGDNLGFGGHQRVKGCKVVAFWDCNCRVRWECKSRKLPLRQRPDCKKSNLPASRQLVDHTRLGVDGWEDDAQPDDSTIGKPNRSGNGLAKLQRSASARPWCDFIARKPLMPWWSTLGANVYVTVFRVAHPRRRRDSRDPREEFHPREPGQRLQQHAKAARYRPSG